MKTRQNASPDSMDRPDFAQNANADFDRESGGVMAAGTTAVGVKAVTFEIDFLEDTSLYVEKVYLANGDSVKAGDKYIKFTEESITDAREELDAFDEFVGDGTVLAAESGIVTEVGYEAGDSLMNAGTLIAFAKADEMTVSVDVSQEDVVAMKVGDTVEISFSAYEGETYQGVIESITTTATSRNSATISYPVVVSIQGDTTLLYSGMTADVTFVTEETENVCYVLRKAVVSEDGKSQLYIKSGDAYVLTPVTTGIQNSEYIEIKTDNQNGINAGDKYYIRTLVQNGGADDE